MTTVSNLLRLALEASKEDPLVKNYVPHIEKYVNLILSTAAAEMIVTSDRDYKELSNYVFPMLQTEMSSEDYKVLLRNKDSIDAFIINFIKLNL